MLASSGAKVQSKALPALGTLATQAGPGVPDAVIVDLRGVHAFPADVALLRRHHPQVGVVIVASQMDPAQMLEAMRAGVNEWVAEPVSPSALTAAVQRVVAQRATKPVTGQVFAFVGAKGGVGTTTVAVNVATVFAKVSHGKALLIDLHLAHGDAAVFLGVEPRFTISDAIENIHRLDEAYLRGVVTTTKAGLHVLPSSERQVAPVANGEAVRELITSGAEHYRYLVLDVPRSDLAMLDSLELASNVVVVANQELATVRRAGALALTLRQRYGKDRVSVVINRFDRHAEIAREDVERVTGGSVRHVIPSDYRIALEGLNKGQPIVVENHNRLAGSFSSLAKDLAGIDSTPASKAERSVGIFGRLGVVRS
jgi:pilus assembly protein CpaE